MSAYELQKLIFHTHTRAECRAHYLEDRSGFAARYELSDEERSALLNLDIGALYRLGVHPLLLRPFTDMNGISSPAHYAALRSGSA
ncbi:MAG: hypothetical protein ACKOCF_07840 [Gammaproteobacteria bacterium]